MEVVQGHEGMTGPKDAQSSIFTTYRIEEDLLYGKVRYTSVDGTQVIQYDQNGNWIIQWKAWTFGLESECPHQRGHTWMYFTGLEWKYMYIFVLVLCQF